MESKKHVGVIATAERGQLTTVICVFSASERFIPPYFKFGQRKRVSKGAPNGFQAWCSDSGFRRKD